MRNNIFCDTVYWMDHFVEDCVICVLGGRHFRDQCFDGLKSLNPGDGGLAEGTAGDPPPNNFAQNQLFCPKYGMLIPQEISNYVQFVSFILHTLPRGDSGICPQKLHFAKSV